MKNKQELSKPIQKSSELKRIRNKITISGDWWNGKTHVLLDMDGTLIDQPGALFHNLFALGVLFRMRSFGSISQLIKAAQKTKEILLSSHSFSCLKKSRFFWI